MQLGASTTQGKQRGRQRKLKMYQWPPQTDPVKEKKRLRAIDRFNRREKCEALIREQKTLLQDTERENASLRKEIEKKRSSVDRLNIQVMQTKQEPKHLQASSEDTSEEDED